VSETANVIPAPVATAVLTQEITSALSAYAETSLEAPSSLANGAGAGGVGLLLTQIAKLRGAHVITTVSTPEKAALSKAAGADFVGGDDVVEKILGGWAEFDAVVATPDMMRAVGRLGKVLGPRGLMPNPKTGTVTPNVAQAIKEIKAGKVEFRVDKTGIIHAPLGKTSFPTQSLIENAHALVDSVVKAKPAAAKGKYLKSVTVSSTMGPGVAIDTAHIDERQK